MRRHIEGVVRRGVGFRYKAGDSINELARNFGMHPKTVRRILREQGVELRRAAAAITAEQRAAMAERYRAGAPIRELAREYGVVYSCVHRHLAAEGVTFRPRGRPGVVESARREVWGDLP